MDIFSVIDNEYEKMDSEDIENAIYRLYLKSLPLIKSIARRYASLDKVVDLEDLVSEGYIAVTTAVKSYDRSKSRDTKFSSFLYWYIQKQFQSLCPPDDRQVELKNGEGEAELISYQKFLKIKRHLPEGTTWTVSSAFIPFEPLIHENCNGKNSNKEVEEDLLDRIERTKRRGKKC